MRIYLSDLSLKKERLIDNNDRCFLRVQRLTYRFILCFEGKSN